MHPGVLPEGMETILAKADAEADLERIEKCSSFDSSVPIHALLCIINLQFGRNRTEEVALIGCLVMK
jgi:hypothetical protein